MTRRTSTRALEWLLLWILEVLTSGMSPRELELFLENRKAHCGGEVEFCAKITIHHVCIQQKEGCNSFFPKKISSDAVTR